MTQVTARLVLFARIRGGGKNVCRVIRRTDLPIRSDLVKRTSAPGSDRRARTWLTGKRRVAVARRSARRQIARLRAHQSLAIAVFNQGTAQECGNRPHSSRSKRPGRLTEKWSSRAAQGLSEGEYVEIVGIVAMVMIMTPSPARSHARAAAARAQGRRAHALPSAGAKKQRMAAAGGAAGRGRVDGPLYPSPKAGLHYRGLSLVPQSVRDYWALANTHYIPASSSNQFDKVDPRDQPAADGDHGSARFGAARVAY